MTFMTFNDYRVSVLSWRHYLLHDWQKNCPETDANCAYMLLCEARKRELTEKKELKGNTLKSWPNQHKSPEWACKTAFFLLLDEKYVPDKDETLAAFVFYWLTEHKPVSADAAFSLFPDYIKGIMADRVIYWMNAFFNK